MTKWIRTTVSHPSNCDRPKSILTESQFGSRLLLRLHAIATPDALSVFRRQFPTGLPQLYEMLVLSYRWLEVHLDFARLLANPPAPDLKPLHDCMFEDPVLNFTLVPAGFVRFAILSECYNPICFDLTHYRDGDCPIVELEHESILCHDRIGDSEQLFPSFRTMVKDVVAGGIQP